jgi:hypothetical protein
MNSEAQATNISLLESVMAFVLMIWKENSTDIKLISYGF